MASVFLSYDRDDTLKAKPIALALEKAGHSVWWDLRIRGGAQFSKVIEEALNAADAVVVLWSAHSIESPWVRDEAAAGRDTGRLVPITIDGTQAPLGFRQFQTLDMSRWNGRATARAFATLLADIEGTVDAKPLETKPAKAMAPAPAGRSALELPPKRSLLAGGAVALLLMVAVGVYWSLGAERTGAASLSVASADQSSLSQSLAHNVLVNLGSVGGDSTSKFRLLDEGSRGDADLRLTVSGVQQGGATQATVALTSSHHDGILWSKQIEVPANDRSALERAAAYAAMPAIACAADGADRESRRLSASDFHAYLNACASLEEADEQSLIPIFRKTVEAAPRFAAAWANLLTAEADTVYNLRVSGEPTEKIEAAIRRDIESARKLNPDLPASSIAEVGVQPPTAFLKRIELIDKAVAAHPGASADLLITRAGELSQVGRMDEALDDYQSAAQLKPYSAAARSNLITALASSGAVAKAWAELAEAKKLWPGSPVIESEDQGINLKYGDFEKTWRAAGAPIDGGISGYFKVLRDPTDANIDGWVNLAKTHKMLHPHRMFILQALGPLHRVDQLYAFMDQWPMEQDLPGLTYILFRPWTANVRRDPRFMRLAQRVGLLDYWEKSGKWPDFCAEPDMPYDCKKEAAKLSA